jgi:chemotaxis protein CheC
MISLTEQQLDSISMIVRFGATDASRALSSWLGREVRVSLDRLQQVSLEKATELLGPVDAAVCACCMQVSGGVNGWLLLGFDDASGWMLCDALLPRETKSSEWGELEVSAAMETTNIVGCAFLNALSQIFPQPEFIAGSNDSTSWIPTPPVFVRDYAAAIMQFALVDQACAFDQVFVTQTEFSIDGTPVGWRLLLVPDAESLDRLSRSLL